MTTFKRFVGGLIWDFSEALHIPLGRLAPVIFGWMIGAKGKRLK